MSKSRKTNLKQITGLWKTKSKKTQKEYLTGKIEGKRFFVFKNEEKKDNQPDYYLYEAIENNEDF